MAPLPMTLTDLEDEAFSDAISRTDTRLQLPTNRKSYASVPYITNQCNDPYLLDLPEP